ncbi:unnamed protein product [Phaedon cochleariae]|uniref:Uncharacterized protein n=1 Tax=Phaedon cochleariae TaxID=80249 RepID=A0A9P0DX32_PHACE|nr:unnamed protein product [Phaedon cochleariae]
MFNCFVFVLLQLFFVVVLSRKIYFPSYLKPCSLSAPDFSSCCLQHGREAIPFILKGDKKFGIPNLQPLNVPYVEVNAGRDLTIFLKDLKVHGLENVDLKLVKIDTKAKRITLKLDVPKLELIGQYKVDGKIMILPIKGEGDVSITAIGGKYEYDFDYVLENVKGEEYMAMTTNDELDFKLEKAVFKLDNLFNGDEVLGKQMNSFLNDNWKEVIGELGGAISQTVGTLARSIVSGIFKKIPYKALILA